MKKLIAGNWKMNLDAAGARALAAEIMDVAVAVPKVELLVCPPYIYLPIIGWQMKDSPVALGGQDCSAHTDGAYTGDVSAKMLKDTGCSYVILGHSERRQHHGETDETVSAKAGLAHAAGLVTIICVGETDAERSAGRQETVVAAQLKGSVPGSATAANTVIAYEPVWAIGTGKTATPDDVKAMHAFIHGQLKDKKTRILYGGSMKPDNAAALLAVPHVDGGLIGGASLKADQFISIAKSA